MADLTPGALVTFNDVTVVGNSPMHLANKHIGMPNITYVCVFLGRIGLGALKSGADTVEDPIGRPVHVFLSTAGLVYRYDCDERMTVLRDGDSSGIAS
jgi:hypothetical protein